MCVPSGAGFSLRHETIAARLALTSAARPPAHLPGIRPAPELRPAAEAATIMPFDSTPRSFRGCRLVTTTTLRPTRSSAYSQSHPRHDLPDFVADIHLQLQQFVGARPLARPISQGRRASPPWQNLRFRFSPCLCGWRCGGDCCGGCCSWHCRGSSRCARPVCRWLCSVPAPWLLSFRYFRFFNSRENAFRLSDLRAGLELSPGQADRAGDLPVVPSDQTAARFSPLHSEARDAPAPQQCAGLPPRCIALFPAARGLPAYPPESMASLPSGICQSTPTSSQIASSASEKLRRSYSCVTLFSASLAKSPIRRAYFPSARSAVGWRNLPAEVAFNHRKRAAGKISQPIGQIAVVAGYQSVVGKPAVLAEHNSRSR